MCSCSDTDIDLEIVLGIVKLRSAKPFDLANSKHYAVKTQQFKMTEGDSIMPLTIIQFLNSLFFTKMNNHNICQDLMITSITMIITVQQQEKSIQARSSYTA